MNSEPQWAQPQETKGLKQFTQLHIISQIDFCFLVEIFKTNGKFLRNVKVD